MTDNTGSYLVRQFATAKKLLDFHLEGLTTAECLWRPAPRSLHVYQASSGSWRVDWPDSEGYELGPPSIAWLTWHIMFWASMVLDHSFGDAKLSREDVAWPGNADDARARIGQLLTDWRAALEHLSDEDLQSTKRTRWPFKDRPFGDVIAWVNVELTKNAAEIGYARFLHAVRR